MPILIVASLSDEHALAVMSALAAQGVGPVELLDLSEVPTRLTVSISFEDGARRLELRRIGGGVLDLDAVHAVWWRRPQPFRLPPGMTAQAHRRFVLSELTTAVQGLFQTMPARWINPPTADQVAAHKPWQLAVAQEVGLTIPPTLMTSDPDAAREFWDRHGGSMIHKQFLALPETWRETRRLRAADMALAESVRHAPVIFQRHVPAVADIRVTAIDGELFAAAADVRDGPYPDDVRFNLAARYVPCKLPDTVADRLRNLLGRMDLVYGAIDLRLTPEGQHVFLEVNPAGQFLFIEQMTGQPISAALAACLAASSRKGSGSPAALR